MSELGRHRRVHIQMIGVVLALGTAGWWTPTPTPAAAAGCSTNGQPAAVGSSQNFYAVAALTSCSIWAVGSDDTHTLVEHWNGSSWHHQTSADPLGGGWFTGVVPLSSRNAWAVGDWVPSTYASMIEHWNGTAWKIVRTPTFLNYNYLDSVAATSSKDVWAVGNYSNGSAFLTLVEHWNGIRWKRMNAPTPGVSGYLKDVVAISASNAWAVGSYSDGTVNHTLIEHWNGTRWKRVASPNAIGPHNSNILEGVTATSAKDAWAVGAFANANGKDQTLVEHWNGAGWARVKSPSPGGALRDNLLSAVAASSTTNAWAVGNYENGSAPRTLIEHWNGRAWRVQAHAPPAGSSSSSLSGVASPSSGAGWEVGDYFAGGNDHFLVMHCC